MLEVYQCRQNPTSGQKNLCFKLLGLTSSYNYFFFFPIGHLTKPHLIQNNLSLSSQTFHFSSCNIYFFPYPIRKKKSAPILGRKKIFKFSECKNGWSFFPLSNQHSKIYMFIHPFTTVVRTELPLLLNAKGFWNDTNLSLCVSRIITLVFTEVVGFPTRGIRLGRSTLPGEHLRKC